MNEENKVMTQPDSFGRHWVYVDQSAVLNHPKGSLGLGIVLCIAWLIGAGGLELYSALTTSFNGVIWYSAALVAAGIGLILRNKIAYLAALFLPLNYIFRVAFGTKFVPPFELYAPGFAAMCIAGLGFVVSFYLFEGDRPNFIYRLRYRSYRAEEGQE